MFGFLNVNKPSGMSSHSIISLLRKITGIKQIGHAGTLDPLASGVLPVAIGKASKLIDYLNDDKEYIAGLVLGKVSDTYDIEGKVEETGHRKIELDEVKEATENFKGTIVQIPPAFSAVHYKGKRLYELARQGKIPDDIPKREITIYKNEIVSFDYEKQLLKLDIECSKGTYIRSIVNDLGQFLGSGAVMCALTRVKSALMNIDNSVSISKETTKEEVIKHLISPEQLLTLPFVEINSTELERVRHGNTIFNKYKVKDSVILTKENMPIALAFADNDLIRPKKLLL